jgi:uncharacterized protein (DUF2237 family)
METAGIEPASCSVQTSGGTMPRPRRKVRTGGVEPPQRVATGLQPAELAGAQRPQEGRNRGSAGGIRTHGLELMRLARTAAPLPRNLAGWSRTSDLRFPKPAGWPAPLQPGDRRPWSRTTLARLIRAAPARPARRRKKQHREAASFPRGRGNRLRIPDPARTTGAPPGNRTLLHGFTTRGLATSLATQSRREESNLRGPG